METVTLSVTAMVDMVLASREVALYMYMYARSSPLQQCRVVAGSVGGACCCSRRWW
jgi:hypothetical protein